MADRVVVEPCERLKPKPKPDGRPPKGMKWCFDNGEWIIDPDAPEPRKTPYVPIAKRRLPAPQGRPFQGTEWCHDSQRYVLKNPHPDAGKAVFKLDFDLIYAAQPQSSEWSSPDQAPAPSP